MSNLPLKLVAPNLAQIKSTRRYLADVLLYPYYGLPLVGDNFAAFVHTVARAFPKAPRDAVSESCRQVLGQTLTLKQAERFAWRMAANAARLRAGRPVRPWDGQQEAEWVAVQIRSAVPGCDRRQTAGAHFLLMVLSGSPCPTSCTKFWTQGQYRYLSRQLGFIRARSGRAGLPFENVHELVGLRLCVLLTPELSRTELVFREVGVPDSFRKFNRSVIKQRRRIGFVCPRGYLHACHRCVVGYDQCPMGTHPVTYFRGDCAECQREGVYFDPLLSREQCLDCAVRARLHPQRRSSPREST